MANFSWLPWRKKQQTLFSPRQEERHRFIENLCGQILPPVPMFNDQFLRLEVLKKFNDYIQNGVGPVPNYDTVYRALAESYLSQRRGFVLELDLDWSSLGFRSFDSMIDYMTFEIKRNDTFEKYLNFRQSFYEKKILPRLQSANRRPYSELRPFPDSETYGARDEVLKSLLLSILPMFSFTRIFGEGCRVFDDQEMVNTATQDFSDYLNFGQQPVPDYFAAYRALAKAYTLQRERFLLHPEQYKLGGHEGRKLFFQPGRPRNPALAAQDEQIRNKIVEGIRANATFEQYLDFRKRLYEEDLLPNLSPDDRVPYFDLTDYNKYERLHRYGLHPTGFKSPALHRLKRLRYVLNICRFILPPFSFERIFGVKVFDDQGLSTEVTVAFLNFIDNEQDPPDYTAIHNKLRQIYEETRLNFLANFRRDPNAVFEQSPFFSAERPDLSLQPAESEMRMRIAREIERCGTFKQYSEFRERLYNEQLFPLTQIPYAQLKDSHDDEPVVTTPPRGMPPRRL